MAELIIVKTDPSETEPSAPELTVRDRQTGKLRSVRGVVWTLEPPKPRRRLELWERDQRRGGLTKVISLQDRRETKRWDERDPEEVDLELLAAYWMGY